MATIPQIRSRLLEGFPEQQADLLAHVVIEAHDDLVNRADFHALTTVVGDLAGKVSDLADAQKDLAEAQKRTESRVEELAEAQKRTESRVGELAEAQKRTETRVGELAEAQKRTETRVGELAESQKDLADAQRITEGTVRELVQTQNRMLIRLDRLDGRSLEQTLFRHLPAYVGRVFRKCRVIEPLDVVDSLEGRLAEAELEDLLLTDLFATAKIGERSIHLVVEVSCTAHSNDVERVVRRAAALAKAGIDAIGVIACEAISPQILANAQAHGVRVLLDGRLVPEAA
jgi:phage-related minor tail protein